MIRNYPKYLWLKSVNAKVEVIGAGHFDNSLMVKAADGSEFEVDMTELYDREEQTKKA